MKALPAELSAMTGLEELVLPGNKKLRSFPASACVGLNKLKFLNLFFCDMQALPAELSAMTGLEIQYYICHGTRTCSLSQHQHVRG